MGKNKSIIFCISLLAVMIIMMNATIAFSAERLPEIVRSTIEQEFPGSVITETSEKSWKGKEALKIELTTKDGIPYEVYMTKNGRFLNAKAEDDELPLIGGELSIGLGVLGEKDIYKDTSSEIEPVPFFRYENGPLEIMTANGIEATLKLLGNRAFSVGLTSSVVMEDGYDADDSDFLKGMDELGTLYFAGLAFSGQYADWEVGLDVVNDISGEHNGLEAELSIEYQWMMGDFQFQPSLSMTWMSKKTVDYFYGVSASEANSERPAYDPGASYEVGLELMVQRPIVGNFSAIGIAGISTFGKDIKDSPLVDGDYAVEGILGFIYTF